MSLPELVRSALGEESVVAHVSLRDEDALFVSPTRTIQYRDQSLLSDESIEEFPHSTERISLTSGRRKTTVSLDYGLDGTRELTVPNDRVDSALHPMLAGVLSAADVTESGETVRQTFLFSELTLVVTDDRLIKHVGGAVWDAEFEAFAYRDLSGLDAEEGRVATQFVLALSDRRERLKIPNERARAFRECLEGALLAHHDIETLSALPALDDSEPEAEDESAVEPMSIEEVDSPATAVSLHELGAEGSLPLARLDALADAMEAQRDLLDDQRRELDRLREELTRAR